MSTEGNALEKFRETVREGGLVRWWQWVMYLTLAAHWVLLLVVDFNYRLGRIGHSSWPLELQWTSFWVISVGGAFVSGAVFLGLGLHAVLQLSEKTRTYHP